MKRILTPEQKKAKRLYQKQYYQKYKERRKQYYQKYKEKINIRQKQYYQGHKEQHKQYYKQYNLNNKEKRRQYNLKRRHNITPEEYNLMYTKQKGRCAICHIYAVQLNKILGIDHDHKTGKIRGLLCDDCNFILGLAKDNSSILRDAIQYLKQYVEE